jgi:hypothetical protein
LEEAKREVADAMVEVTKADLVVREAADRSREMFKRLRKIVGTAIAQGVLDSIEGGEGNGRDEGSDEGDRDTGVDNDDDNDEDGDDNDGGSAFGGKARSQDSDSNKTPPYLSDPKSGIPSDGEGRTDFDAGGKQSRCVVHSSALSY